MTRAPVAPDVALAFFSPGRGAGKEEGGGKGDTVPAGLCWVCFNKEIPS